MKNSAPSSAFQKIRRRLTITGSSDTIDGVSKLSVSEEDAPPSSSNTASHKDPNAVSEYAGMSKKGHAPYNPRKNNQDALIMTDDPSTNTLILCALDGHGEHGDMVACAFRDQLAQMMIDHPKWRTDVKAASADAIAAIEASTVRNYRIDTEFSGTTLSMAIVRGNTITGVNIGDSRVIIGKSSSASSTSTSTSTSSTTLSGAASAVGKGKAGGANVSSGSGSSDIIAEEFTHDHKPDLPEEKKRILAAGGRVFAVEYDDGIDGPPRVWLGHMDVPGLAMSRSLGDSVAHTAGVSSEPEFTERELDPATDKFVVVATDGLWEFVTNDQAAEFVHRSRGPTDSVDVLVQEANRRWMDEEQVIDDTTVITAFLFDYKKSA